MKIIILGAGQVGSSLAENLTTEANDIIEVLNLTIEIHNDPAIEHFYLDQEHVYSISTFQTFKTLSIKLL